MTKINFILLLSEKLKNLPEKEVEERLSFYSEMIEDRMEEGFSEEGAVEAVGTVDKIAEQIIKEISVPKTSNKKVKSNRRLKAWEKIMLIAGSPLWMPLLVAFIAVIFSLYVSLWAVVISLWAVFAAVVSCALSGIVAGVGVAFTPNKVAGVALFGAGIACAGFAILCFLSCKAVTKGVIILTKKIISLLKDRLTRKEKV